MNMINDEYKYSDLTARIIKCAMAVHSYPGNGFMEVIYQRALEYEFLLEGLRYKRELELDIYYKDLPEPRGNRMVDFPVEEKVLAETKAIILLDDIHLAQVIQHIIVFIQ